MSEFEDGGVQNIESTPEVRPDARYHTDRASARTAEERRQHFEHWLAKYGETYAEAVREAGDEPWTDDVEERWQLWQRRYQRPEPPNMPTIKSIPRSHAPEISHEELDAA